MMDRYENSITFIKIHYIWTGVKQNPNDNLPVRMSIVTYLKITLFTLSIFINYKILKI